MHLFYRMIYQTFYRIECGVQAINALDDLMIDVDVLIKTRNDVETFKTVPASLTRKIVEQDTFLYGQSKTQPINWQRKFIKM